MKMIVCYSCVWGQDCTNVPFPRVMGNNAEFKDSHQFLVQILVLLMSVLFESWLPSDRLESQWKGTRSAGFDGQPNHFFTDMFLFEGWLHATLMCGRGKRKTLVMCIHLEVSINMPAAVQSISLWLKPGFPDTSASIVDLWSSALTPTNIPESDSHTLTDVQLCRHSAKYGHWYSQSLLKYFLLRGHFLVTLKKLFPRNTLIVINTVCWDRCHLTCSRKTNVQRWSAIDAFQAVVQMWTFKSHLIELSLFSPNFYIFLQTISRFHNDGRMLDVFQRLTAKEGKYFLPQDLELSNQELSYIVKKAEQWRGFNGERRKVNFQIATIVYCFSDV